MTEQIVNRLTTGDPTTHRKNSLCTKLLYLSRTCRQPFHIFSHTVILNFSVLLLISFLLLLSLIQFIPFIQTQNPIHAEALQIQEGDDQERSGDPGTEATYRIRVANDNPYPIDILGEVEESAWNSSFARTEFLEILPSESVTFFLIVTIPWEPDLSFSETIMMFSERPSYQTIIQYEPQIQLEVNTTLIDKKEKSSDVSGVEEMSDLAMEFGLLTAVIIILISGVHCYSQVKSPIQKRQVSSKRKG